MLSAVGPGSGARPQSSFSQWERLEVASAGVSADADEPVTAEHLEWADIVFVMERSHRRKLQQRFGTALKNARLTCLGIPDNFALTEPGLVRLLEAKVTPHLR
ncbi:protein-tyrosine-phosphatase [Methylobacterium haplocladii]|uniref:Protein-tyrosine-phosphatase n=1 Tax=Methylobacterium haplocladii TaxID=1176176 RepID=A0A512ITK5_9HYPH|nr:protein-tyrosine-phosphatase [Methylobacterium haplocladii]GLS58315.1 protein-tyrosine-phosphatase [Methylobacterium haplocladii]